MFFSGRSKRRSNAQKTLVSPVCMSQNDTPKWVMLGATRLTQELYNRNVMEADHLDTLLIFNSFGLSSEDNIFTKDPCNVLPEEKQLHTQHYL